MVLTHSSVGQGPRVWPWHLLISVAWAGLCLLALLLVPQSDDWFFARISREMGFFTAFSHIYQTWTGLWLCLTLVIGLPVVIGPFWAVRLESLIAIHALWLGVYAVLGSLFPNISRQHGLGAAGGIVALGIVTSQAQEGVYWGATACNYSMGLAWVLLLWSYAYRHPEPTGKQRLVVLLVAMVTPGFSESVAVIAGGLLTLGWLLRPTIGWLIWTYALLGLTLGSLPVIFCPGNALRLEASGGMRPLAETTALVLSQMWHFFDGKALLIWAVIVALPTIFQRLLPRPETNLRPLVITVGLVVIIGWAAMFPAALGTGEITPHIANLGWYSVFSLLIVTGWTTGRWLTNLPDGRIRLLFGGLLLLTGLGLLAEALLHGEFVSLSTLAIMVLGALILGVPRVSQRILTVGCWLLLAFLLFRDLAYDATILAPRRAHVWNERDSLLRAAAKRSEAVVLVPALPDTAYPRLSFLSDLTLSPGLGWSEEIAKWYGVKRIWVDQRQEMPENLRRLWESSFAAEVLLYENRIWTPGWTPAPTEP